MFGIHPMILIGIGICLMILCWTLFQEKCIEWIARAIVGCVIIYGINQIVPQYAIGINTLSIACTGLLGLPGVTLLYVIGYMV